MREALDVVYGRAASFGRDVFHYIVTGTAFVIVCSIPWWPAISQLQDSSVLPMIDSTWIPAIVLFATMIVLFCIGHVLLSVGFCIRNMVWMKLFSCCEHVIKYGEAIQRVKCLSSPQVGEVDMRDVHLDAELDVFVRRRDVHANFIERYNTLWHFRLGMAASLLCAGVVGGGIGSCCGDPVLASGAGIAGILGGFLFMRQHLVTNTSFLNRVVTAYQVVQQEARKPETKP